MPSPAERARVSVTKAIKAAVRAVAKDCPALGAHLEASIQHGSVLLVRPSRAGAPRWVL